MIEGDIGDGAIELAQAAIAWMAANPNPLAWTLAALAMVASAWGVWEARRRPRRGDQAEEACAVADLPPMPMRDPQPCPSLPFKDGLERAMVDDGILAYGKRAAAPIRPDDPRIQRMTRPVGLWKPREHDGPGGVVRPMDDDALSPIGLVGLAAGLAAMTAASSARAEPEPEPWRGGGGSFGGGGASASWSDDSCSSSSSSSASSDSGPTCDSGL